MPDAFAQTVLYEDNHLLVVAKPSGILVQGDSTGDETLLDMGKAYIKEKYNKPGNVYLGLVHRLDRPVSGVVVFARTSKAAGRLSEQVREHVFKKTYWALVHGKTPVSGIMIDYIERHGVNSVIRSKEQGKFAELSYHQRAVHDAFSWVEISLKTGRHHQIRVQFAHRQHPIVGDFRYGSQMPFGQKSLALHAYKVAFIHPVHQEQVEFTALPESHWPSFIVEE